MSLARYEAVLFDLDGVILDSMEHHAGLWQELLAAEGYPVDREFILHNEGALGREVLEAFLAEQGLAAEARELEGAMQRLLAAQAGRYLAECAHLVRPYPEAPAVLAGLARAGVPAALVTSSRRRVMAACLPAELLAGFAAVVTAEDVPRHKPHPDPYLAGAAALGADPARCLAVENAPAGIASALAAGADCHAISSTLPTQSLAGAGAVFPSLAAWAREMGVPVA
jgi:HAD superfamily hydrolase (TIGR01509 family)